MYPLTTIIEFLLAGVNRIPAEERVEVLLAMFAGLLPDMAREDIAIAREQVIAKFWTSPETADEVVNLLEGHVMLRELLAEMTEEVDDVSEFGRGRDGEETSG